MRNISAALTKNQILASLERVKIGKPPVKDVTRRIGWTSLKPGERLQVVEKGQGLKKGEKAVKLCVIEVVSVRLERVSKMRDQIDYGLTEVKREGFHDLTPSQFVTMFCDHNNIKPHQEITRIEFRYVV